MEIINISHCILYSMKLARIAEGKKIKRWFIPLLALLLTSLVFSTGSVSAVPVTLFHSTFDAYDNDNSIEGWTVKQSSGFTQDSYAGDGVLILYPNEGIDRSIPQDNFPNEANFSMRFNLYKTYWEGADDSASILGLCSNGWNTGGSGYWLLNSYISYEDSNDTFTFSTTAYDHYIRYYNMDPSYAWGVEMTFHRWDAIGGGGSYHIMTYDVALWRDYYVAPGDEITIPLGTNLSLRYSLDDSNFANIWFRIGPYSTSDWASPGDLWVKDINFWWDDSTTPPGPIVDYNETDGIVENLVHQIVFFIPILVLTSFFGRIGFIGGVGLMSVIWMFTDTSFIAPGMMIFIALGILVYKGGME